MCVIGLVDEMISIVVVVAGIFVVVFVVAFIVVVVVVVAIIYSLAKIGSVVAEIYLLLLLFLFCRC